MKKYFDIQTYLSISVLQCQFLYLSMKPDWRCL